MLGAVRAFSFPKRPNSQKKGGLVRNFGDIYILNQHVKERDLLEVEEMREGEKWVLFVCYPFTNP
jgi:hypothetical protein